MSTVDQAGEQPHGRVFRCSLGTVPVSAAVAGGVPTRRRDWRDDAACRREDPELFFPVGTRGPAARQIEQARAVCAGCPVRSDCLLEALAAGVEGIWGGLTEDERRDLLRAPTRRAVAA